MNIPQRQSLIQQTLIVLRKGIAEGIWEGALPGERELSRRLQVSRPTLRAALGILEREMYIKVDQGKGRSILTQKQTRKPSVVKTVTFVSSLPLYSMSRNRIFLIDYLYHMLQENDLRLEIVSNPGFGSNRPARALRLLERREEFQVFALLLSSQAVQQWFCEQALPSIVLGSAFPGVPIPSLDCDYQSISYHASGVFLGKGHRRLVLAVPDTNHAGDMETEAGFLNGIERSGHADAHCQVIRYGASSQDLIFKVDSVLASDSPPTAFFVLNLFAATTLLTHLLSCGIRVPEDVSIISRDGDEIFDWTQPKIAHYIFPLRRLASKLSRLVIEMTESGPLPLRHTSIMPEFCKGGSVGMAPGQKSIAV